MDVQALTNPATHFELRNVGYRPPPPRPGLIVNPPPPSYFQPKYFGPVSIDRLPKGMPTAD